MSRLQELIATDAALGGDKQTLVAMDCEGVPEELQLMQIATADGVAVIDCGTIGARAVCEALTPLLTSTRTVKLLHDLKMDAVAIHSLGGVELNGCIDSQLCMEAMTGNVHMGFNPMLEELGFDAHPTKRRVHASMRTENVFAARPLPAYLIEYAALDASLLYDSAAVLLERIKEARVPVSVLRAASDALARLAISAMIEFGPEAARRRRVCFDMAHGYRLASRELLEAWRPEDLQASTPIVVFGMRQPAALPPLCSERLPTRS
jgi:ribonuclease D